jgi:cold shock CspA family protein
MPRGVMIWFDPSTGEGRVRHGSRELVVEVDEVEPAARVAGARVTFDLVRVKGGQRAARVRLKRGKRVSPRRSRFGDLTGAHHPDQKGHRPLHGRMATPERVHRSEDQPVEVARRWLQGLAQGDVSTTSHLYTSDARLHDGASDERGPSAVRRFLDTTTVRGRHDGRIEPAPDGPQVMVRWPEDEGTTEIELRIAHGQIAEQWAR